ncbi:histidine kinase [Campylobacter estrildidarum]|uniref:Histidine kinase n=1 Tax=Campylobacter estrildidarum TaxID=2510189 RepID=A0A4U7BIC0_9BACT|nr:histidine kinase [Campylobacter estrildidarum]TKX31543.1 histidine kinase [Campylobacter estrildidarum]
MQNYKKLGIEHFLKKDFKAAKVYFSLAYEKRKNKRLFNFILLCDLALKFPKEAILLFEFYLEHYSVSKIDKDFEEIFKTIEAQNEKKSQNELEDGHALNYQDFLKSEQQIGFKKSFENVINSTKLVIDNRDDFLDFLEKLVDNGYKDMTLNYIENVLAHFWANEKFIRIQEKLIGFKSENQA